MELSAVTSYDVVVIGAGAAGLMAALCAAEHGARVLLLEKNRKPGIKILMSGGTRCNITHATDERGIVAAYGTQGRFLHSPLASFGVQDTLDFFAAEGVATKVEENGKIFPVSNKALDVLNALLSRLARSGAALSVAEPVLDLQKADPGFLLTTPNRTVAARHVLLTTGGLSYPGSGTTGDGYTFAARLGHTIVPTRPALVPITVAVPWVRELRGITLGDIGLRILDANKVLSAGRGSLLFAHFGLTGPVVLDASRAVSGHANPTSLRLELDLLPDVKEMELDDWLRVETAAAGKKLLAAVLSTRLTRRLADVLLTEAALPTDRKAAALSKPDRQKLVAGCKRLGMPITGTLGYGKAEVTAGGIDLSEVDSKTMQSKRVSGLFLAGEVLDLDGPIGGYNFQAAWSTGWLAGMTAAQAR